VTLLKSYLLLLLLLGYLFDVAWDRLYNRFVSVSVCVCLWALLRSHFLIDFH